MSSFVYHAVSKAAPRKSLACPKGLRADLAAPDIVAPPDRSGHRSSAPELKFHASTLLLRSATVRSSSSSIKAFYVNSLWCLMNPSPTGRHFTHKPLMFQKPLFCKGFANSTATFLCYETGMGEWARWQSFPI